MNKFKIHKTTLASNNWKELFQTLENDTQRVAQFVKGARKAKNIRANDLDTILHDISSTINEYVTMDCSGSFDFS